MDMKRIEAPTLEEAYRKASEEFNCSITEINYEVIQYPTSGIMGLFKKPAILVVAKKVVEQPKVEKRAEKVVEKRETTPPPPPAPAVNDTVESDSRKVIEEEKKIVEKNFSKEDNRVVDSFFDSSRVKSETEIKPQPQKSSRADFKSFSDDRDTPKNIALSKEIELKIIKLMKSSCFSIDTVEVDVFNKIAHIFIDGDDAALLIGKEGYRYNALSYMLFNWINARYGLYIKLEIAEFIQSQEEMIINYLKPIIEHIEQNGRGKTKPLDGILVQIALEQLRARFPNKYVAIKTAKDNRKFIIINNFNNSKT